MKTKRIALSVVLVAAVAACTDSPTAPGPAAPSFGTISSNIVIEAATAIGNPDAAYLASTTKIDFSGIPDYTLVSSITDGTTTVNFATDMDKRTAPSGGWSTNWGFAPYVESGTPAVLFTSYLNTQTLTISGPTGKKAIKTFGFELQGNLFDTNEFTADFYNGTTLIGSVTRTVSTPDGARLFAICVGKEGPITSVHVYWTGSGNDPLGFAIAQVRYDSGKCGGGKIPR
jgi:hypothetical protein